MSAPSLAVLHNLATQLRIDSVRSTTAAGSGHPTSCMSAADIVAALFFAEMRFDPQDPHHPEADRFVLSKGHAAPILYAVWAAAGAFPREDLLQLRKLGSDLEGHPTPRLPFVDVATGSLGQGLCAAVGMALNARRIQSDYRTYALLGDGETAEGAIWEAAQAAAFHKLDNLCAITDVNGFGQSRGTQWDHHLDEFTARWSAFGWHTITIDGHDLSAILSALAEAKTIKARPTMIVAKTLKGKGVAAIENKDGWHGKALKAGKEADAAIAELEQQYVQTSDKPPVIPKPGRCLAEPPAPDFETALAPPAYKPGSQVATREAYGDVLVALGAADPRIVALDADVKNST
ncbi:MAG TPA: thiamine pyrophosphate-dependent enzyme, partial [Vicinamibacterales bacterium]